MSVSFSPCPSSASLALISPGSGNRISLVINEPTFLFPQNAVEGVIVAAEGADLLLQYPDGGIIVLQNALLDTQGNALEIPPGLERGIPFDSLWNILDTLPLLFAGANSVSSSGLEPFADYAGDLVDGIDRLAYLPAGAWNTRDGQAPFGADSPASLPPQNNTGVPADGVPGGHEPDGGGKSDGTAPDGDDDGSDDGPPSDGSDDNTSSDGSDNDDDDDGSDDDSTSDNSDDDPSDIPDPPVPPDPPIPPPPPPPPPPPTVDARAVLYLHDTNPAQLGAADASISIGLLFNGVQLPSGATGYSVSVDGVSDYGAFGTDPMDSARRVFSLNADGLALLESGGAVNDTFTFTVSDGATTFTYGVQVVAVPSDDLSLTGLLETTLAEWHKGKASPLGVYTIDSGDGNDEILLTDNPQAGSSISTGDGSDVLSIAGNADGVTIAMGDGDKTLRASTPVGTALKNTSATLGDGDQNIVISGETGMSGGGISTGNGAVALSVTGTADCGLTGADVTLGSAAKAANVHTVTVSGAVDGMRGGELVSKSQGAGSMSITGGSGAGIRADTASGNASVTSGAAVTVTGSDAGAKGIHAEGGKRAALASTYTGADSAGQALDVRGTTALFATGAGSKAEMTGVDADCRATGTGTGTDSAFGLAAEANGSVSLAVSGKGEVRISADSPGGVSANGVYCNNATASVTAGTGTMTITAEAQGTGTAHGMRTLGGGAITATGGGAVTITAKAEAAGAAGLESHIAGAATATIDVTGKGDGAISVTAVAGTAVSTADVYGVNAGNKSAISLTAKGDGDIILGAENKGNGVAAAARAASGNSVTLAAEGDGQLRAESVVHGAGDGLGLWAQNSSATMNAAVNGGGAVVTGATRGSGTAYGVQASGGGEFSLAAHGGDVRIRGAAEGSGAAFGLSTKNSGTAAVTATGAGGVRLEAESAMPGKDATAVELGAGSSEVHITAGTGDVALSALSAGGTAYGMRAYVSSGNSEAVLSGGGALTIAAKGLDGAFGIDSYATGAGNSARMDVISKGAGDIRVTAENEAAGTKEVCGIVARLRSDVVLEAKGNGGVAVSAANAGSQQACGLSVYDKNSVELAARGAGAVTVAAAAEAHNAYGAWVRGGGKADLAVANGKLSVTAEAGGTGSAYGVHTDAGGLAELGSSGSGDVSVSSVSKTAGHAYALSSLGESSVVNTGSGAIRLYAEAEAVAAGTNVAAAYAAGTGEILVRGRSGDILLEGKATDGATAYALYLTVGTASAVVESLNGGDVTLKAVSANGQALALNNSGTAAVKAAGAGNITIETESGALGAEQYSIYARRDGCDLTVSAEDGDISITNKGLATTGAYGINARSGKALISTTGSGAIGVSVENAATTSGNRAAKGILVDRTAALAGGELTMEASGGGDITVTAVALTGQACGAHVTGPCSFAVTAAGGKASFSATAKGNGIADGLLLEGGGQAAATATGDGSLKFAAVGEGTGSIRGLRISGGTCKATLAAEDGDIEIRADAAATLASAIEILSSDQDNSVVTTGAGSIILDAKVTGTATGGSYGVFNSGGSVQGTLLEARGTGDIRVSAASVNNNAMGACSNGRELTLRANGGDITVSAAKGGSANTNTCAHGLYASNSSLITLANAGAGAIDILGTNANQGGNAAQRAYGVFASNAGAEISSEDGGITLSGKAVSNSSSLAYGCYVIYGQGNVEVEATGTGSITVTGDAIKAQGAGVNAVSSGQASFISNFGKIIIAGTNATGADANGTANGVFVQAGSGVTVASHSGDIILSGRTTGGTSSSGVAASGIRAIGAGAKATVSTVDGNILAEAASGSTSATAGTAAAVLALSQAGVELTATGAGSITVRGEDYGVRTAGAAATVLLTAHDGDITIEAATAACGRQTDVAGVSAGAGTTVDITGTGDGAIRIAAESTVAGKAGMGLNVEGTCTVTGKDIDISGSALADANAYAVNAAGSVTINGTGGDDHMTFTGRLVSSGTASAIDAGAGHDVVSIDHALEGTFTLNGGDGWDTLHVGRMAAGGILDCGDLLFPSKVTGFESLDMTDGEAGTLAVSQADLTAILGQMSPGASLNFTHAGGAETALLALTVTGDDTDTLQLNLIDGWVDRGTATGVSGMQGDAAALTYTVLESAANDFLLVEQEILLQFV